MDGDGWRRLRNARKERQPPKEGIKKNRQMVREGKWRKRIRERGIDW